MAVPVEGGFGRVFKIASQPVNMQLAAYYNVTKPNRRGRLAAPSLDAAPILKVATCAIALPTPAFGRAVYRGQGNLGVLMATAESDGLTEPLTAVSDIAERLHTG